MAAQWLDGATGHRDLVPDVVAGARDHQLQYRGGAGARFLTTSGTSTPPG
jgi:hypothetical protein